jgi:hypothetical protein
MLHTANTRKEATGFELRDPCLSKRFVATHGEKSAVQFLRQRPCFLVQNSVQNLFENSEKFRKIRQVVAAFGGAHA